MPGLWIPTRRAAVYDRSMIRPRIYGPRSLIRTTIDWPVFRLVTRTHEPKGRVLWAAVIAYWLYRSPFAVSRPWNFGPYHEARPVWITAALSGGLILFGRSRPRGRERAASGETVDAEGAGVLAALLGRLILFGPQRTARPREGWKPRSCRRGGRESLNRALVVFFVKLWRERRKSKLLVPKSGTTTPTSYERQQATYTPDRRYFSLHRDGIIHKHWKSGKRGDPDSLACPLLTSRVPFEDMAGFNSPFRHLKKQALKRKQQATPKPKPKSPALREQPPAHNDAELFQREMQDVIPLKKDGG